MSQPGDDPATTAYVYTVLRPALSRLAAIPPVAVAAATANVYEFKFFQASGEIRRYVDRRNQGYLAETPYISEACTLIYSLVEDINSFVAGYSVDYFKSPAPFDNFLGSLSRAFAASTTGTNAQLADTVYYAAFQRDVEPLEDDKGLDAIRASIVNRLETVKEPRIGVPFSESRDLFATTLPLSRAVRRETRECVRILNFAPVGEFDARLEQLDYFIGLVSRNPAVSVPANLMDEVSWALAEGDLTFAGPRRRAPAVWGTDRSPWMVWDPTATSRASEVAERRDYLRQLVLNLDEDPRVATLQRFTGRIADSPSRNPLEQGAHWGDEDLPY